jgi:hypothetical protein
MLGRLRMYKVRRQVLTRMLSHFFLNCINEKARWEVTSVRNDYELDSPLYLPSNRAHNVHSLGTKFTMNQVAILAIYPNFARS